MVRRTLTAAVLLLALPVLALAVDEGAAPALTTWKIDPAHSSVGFKVKHLVITNVRGEFREFSATATTKGDDLSTLQVEATIQLASVDTGNAKRDEHLASPDFFDVAQFPEMTFKSRKVTGVAPSLQILGDLTLHGVTKEVTLAVEGPTPEIKDPWGNVKVGVSAATRIDRSAFGVSWSKALESGGLVVANDVDITLELEIVKVAAPAPTAAAGQ